MKKKGFSLIELSIVLIIIALLIVGVASGAKLVKQAKLMSLINEMMELKSAHLAFMLQYDYRPGDFPKAFDFFGSSYPSDNCTNTVGEVKSCNGDGNGEIDNSSEMFRAKQHLSLAELIQGDFSGHFNSIPRLASRVFSDAIYETQKCSLLGYLNVHGDMGTCILYGSNINRNTVPVLIPEDQYIIDKKIDDGFPFEGNIRFRVGGDITTSTCGNSTTGYILSNKTKGCNMIFSIDK